MSWHSDKAGNKHVVYGLIGLHINKAAYIEFKYKNIFYNYIRIRNINIQAEYEIRCITTSIEDLRNNGISEQTIKYFSSDKEKVFPPDYLHIIPEYDPDSINSKVKNGNFYQEDKVVQESPDNKPKQFN